MTLQAASLAARLSIVAVLLLSDSPLPAADWPHMLGPNRDGQSTETGLNWTWGANGPPIAWSLDVGTGFAGVSVANGRVFLFHRIGDDEILTALEPATGKETWKYTARTRYRDEFNFDNGPRCVPAVAGSRVFALGPNGDFHAVDEKTGKGIWTRNLLTDYKVTKGYFGVGAGPIVVGDRVLVNVGGRGAGIVAFDVATGKELGKATDDPASYSSPTLMEIGGKPAGVFFTRTGLVVIDPVTMAVKHTKYWRARLDASVNAATPLVRDGDIFLTASYATGATRLRFKPGTEEPDEVWANDKSLSSQYNTPVFVGDFLYGIDGRADGGGARLRCVEWATGAVKWSKDGFGCASVMAVDGGLLALTQDGELVRFDADSKLYTERARAKVLDAPSRAAPALSDGRLFIRDEKKLVCVKLK